MIFIGCSKNCPNLTVGDQYEGGIIFYVDGCECKIVSRENMYEPFTQSEKMHWTNASITCTKYESEGHSDWYLPSLQELKLIHENIGTQFAFSGIYWSNDDFDDALIPWPLYKGAVDIQKGNVFINLHSDLHYVRAVRRCNLEN